MPRFEYQIRSDLHEAAENAARPFGGRETERLNAYSKVIVSELNKLGAEGWELLQAPESQTNRNWVFKRQLA